MSRNIFERIGDFTGLTVLDLNHYRLRTLSLLPESIGNLAALETLGLSEWKAIARLPDSIVKLRRLRTLDLAACEALTMLPERIEDLASLTILNLNYCKQLAGLPDSFYNLTKLTNLRCCNTRVATLSEQCIGGLASLSKFSWGGKPENAAAIQVPRGIGKLQALTALSLHSSRLTRLPDGICDLEALKLLDLCCCHALTHLPARIGELQALTYLDLSQCYALSSLPDSIVHLRALRHVDLDQCRLLANIPQSIQKVAQEH
ncbi:hypothetical protein JKP88DRAFT_177608 [Tribonema minus]|uniref:Uncharacterized protein n=1 Tax=Tribonema minus TaxID=303371 RepID=A0A836CKM6_9STRA|nr:hypothetical protein JKP88DRAFT_177608 [Tribonema minus]